MEELASVNRAAAGGVKVVVKFASKKAHILWDVAA